jgi:hypothetical protein
MSKTINLPSGATATLRDAKSLRQKDRLALFAGIEDDQSVLDRGMQMVSNMITILVESWTLDLVPPSVRPDILGELELADYDALAAEAQAAMPLLYPKLAQTPETEADPKATGGGSNA